MFVCIYVYTIQLSSKVTFAHIPDASHTHCGRVHIWQKRGMALTYVSLQLYRWVLRLHGLISCASQTRPANISDGSCTCSRHVPDVSCTCLDTSMCERYLKAELYHKCVYLLAFPYSCEQIFKYESSLYAKCKS